MRRKAKEAKRKKNREKWRKHQWHRFNWMRIKKQKTKERLLSGNRYGTHMIVIMHNKKLYHKLKTYKWSLKANDYFNTVVEKNKTEVLFPKAYVQVGKGLECIPADYEILLVRKTDGEFRPEDVEVMRDENGKVVHREIEGHDDYVVMRREVWLVEEKFALVGHDPFKDRFDYRRIKSELIGEDLSYDDTKRIMKRNNRLMVLSDDGSMECVITKTRQDCDRLYEQLYNDCDRNFVFFLGDVGSSLNADIRNGLKEIAGDRKIDIIFPKRIIQPKQ